MKSRLNMNGLEIGRGYFKGQKLPQLSGKNHPSWKPKVEKECKFCQRKMLLVPHEVKRNKNFCSTLCYSTWHRGKNSPVFKGDKAVSKFRNRVMQLPEYQEWRKVILLRDDYTCQVCNFRNEGKDRRTIEVDHIKRFLLIVNENNLRTIEDARSCKELWDTNNGRTICRTCHRKSNTYGTRGLKC